MIGGYTLPDHVENGDLLSFGDLYGNALDNRLTKPGTGSGDQFGYGGNDTLRGGALDYLFGGLGDDTYFMDHTEGASNTRISELVGEGTDTVHVRLFESGAFGGGSGASYTLPTNVENGTLEEHAEPSFVLPFELHGNSLEIS